MLECIARLIFGWNFFFFIKLLLYQLVFLRLVFPILLQVLLLSKHENIKQFIQNNFLEKI